MSSHVTSTVTIQTSAESVLSPLIRFGEVAVVAKEEKTGGLWDQQGNQWLIFDVDGTGASRSPTSLAFHP